MSKGRPWYPRYPSDFILGTVHMDLETRGAYSTIIDLLNDRDRPIPDEPRFIAGFLNCSVRKWNVIRARLIADGKLALNDHGEITNPRFEREHLGRAERREFLAEKGREGGLKSAAMRAKREPELPLSSTLRPQESRENELKVKDKSSLSKRAPKKTKHLAQAPPQASRARKSPETRVYTSERTNRSAPHARAHARIAPDDALPLVLAASGFHPSGDGHRLKALEFVSAWIEIGVDIEALAVPIIERIIASAPDKTTGSLARFDKQIRAEHAAALASAKTRKAQPMKPAQPDDDDPRIPPLREQLKQSCGPRTYDGWLRPCTFAAEPDHLTIVAPSTFMADWLLDNLGPSIGKLAQAQGFASVRIANGKPP